MDLPLDPRVFAALWSANVALRATLLLACLDLAEAHVRLDPERLRSVEDEAAEVIDLVRGR